MEDYTSSSENPYAAPQAQVEPEARLEQPLASRWLRLAGVLLDTVILLVLTIPVMIYFIWDRIEEGLTVPEEFAWAAFSMGVFLLCNGYLLFRNGQTLAKSILGTQIVSVHTGRPIGGVGLILKRYFIPAIFGVIPGLKYIYGLLNVLLIFRDDKRCLHDHIAGTKVIRLRS